MERMRPPFWVGAFFVKSRLKPFILIKLTVALFLLYQQLLFATNNNVKQILLKAKNMRLAENPVWSKLLHYEKREKNSVVISNDFFLASNGKNNPESELTETIKAYFLPWGKNPDTHPRCRFPARYYWLSQQLNLPDYKLPEEKCQRLKKWALFKEVKSVSLILISSYLGNPASTFGHSILKLNTDAVDDPLGFFDLSVNYGAMVPENENTLLYVLRGLFGGYKAGFSDKYFYTEDLTYSHTEQRDMWNYKLALTDYQRILLILHIWEILGKKFIYYFLNKNCAYRLGELVDLVLEEDLVQNNLFWYPPVKLFHRLNDIDKKRLKVKKRKLVKSVSFIPSRQRILYNRLKILSKRELKTFNAIIAAGPQSISRKLKNFSDTRKILILDSLLAYQQYKLVATRMKPDNNELELKRRILLERLLLPPFPKAPLNIRSLPSPADGLRPLLFGIGINKTEKERFIRMDFSPFKQENIGQRSFGNDEISVFDFSFGFSEKKRDVFLNRLELLRILSLKTLPVAVIKENRLSWQLRFAIDRINSEEKHYYDVNVVFGAGRSWKIWENIIFYTFLDLTPHSIFPYMNLCPNGGFKIKHGNIKSSIYLGLETKNYKPDLRKIFKWKTEYQFISKAVLYFEVSQNRYNSMSFGLNSYW